MSKMNYSKQEQAFFDEGDTLSEQHISVEDFSDLDEGARVNSWVERALALLAPIRSGS